LLIWIASNQTKLTDRVAILRELKRGASFSLKKKDYEGILSRIQTANSILHDLMGQNCGLEPSRRHRSQARLIGLIRGLTRSIFNSLRSASACCCVKSHDVCLELEPREAILVPTDADDQVARKFDFHVGLGFDETRENENSSPELAARRWESIRIKLAKADTKPSVPCSTSPVPVQTRPKASRGVGWTKSLSFKFARETPSSSSSVTQTLVDVSQSLLVAPMTSASAASVPAPVPREISELCRARVRNPKAVAVDCYGYIADAEHKFELRPPEIPPASARRTAVTLRQVLTRQASDPSWPPFEYPDKLRVAVALAVSILHLYKTPWLPRVVTLDDVLFLLEDGWTPSSVTSGHSAYMYRPFVVRNLKDSERPSHPQSREGPRPVNLTVLSLGVLLIQLIIGRVVDELDISGSADMDSILEKHEAGSRLSGEVTTSGGLNFATAVRWCLDTVLEVATLENDGFCQSFYGAVVAKLRDDAKLVDVGC
jgi:hypothetical protein